MKISIDTDNLTIYRLAVLYSMLIKIGMADEARNILIVGAEKFGANEFGKELSAVLYN